jgi:thiol-disulfide isomerase/thioredoxin
MRPFKISIAIVGALLAAAGRGASQTRNPPVTVITGTLLGADGVPMKLAHANLLRGLQQRLIVRSLVGADGRFAIATTDTGAFQLKFTGVDHYAAYVPLMLAIGDRIALNVHLKHHAYATSFDSVTAVGEFTHFRSDSGRPLLRQPDGRFALEVDTPADTLAYQLWHVESGRGVGSSGTQTARYVYRDGTGYYAVIPAVNGKATITFDPSALRPVPGGLTVVFLDTTVRAARISRLMIAWNDRITSFFDSSDAVRARHDSLRYDWAPIIRGMKAGLRRVRDPLARQLGWLQLMMASQLAGAPDTAVARLVIAAIPPSSAVYTADANALNATLAAYRAAFGSSAAPRAPLDTAVSRRMLDHLERIAFAQSDSDVQMRALYAAMSTARTLHDDVRMNADYQRLVTDYGDASLVRYVKSMFASNRVLQVGAQIPDFSFGSLDDSTIRYSRQALAGKTYLLEFWATWCGPCVMEMKYLHAAHDSLAPLGLEMLSVSLDQSAADARHFRQGEWKMPWLNAFAPGGWENPEVRRMEILGIPRAALIGPDGRILAVDEQLRADSLIPTVRRVLQGPRSP